MKKPTVPRNAMTRNALAALRSAVAKVVQEHLRDGRPLAIWRDGKAVLVSPQNLAIIRETPAIYKTHTPGKK